MTQLKQQKENVVSIQKHMLDSEFKWAAESQKDRETFFAFKTEPRDGSASRMIGAYAYDDRGCMVWFQFSDLDRVQHKIEFPAFWIPKDCREVAQQVYMHLNTMIGRDEFADLKPVREAHAHRVFDGRIKSLSGN